mmetsp:Transcript_24567/g.80226  ORF Transcript_24567/g.80226 Transcript_24567/m.80226 type:complete len:80 (-) Transcript_24567:760-999(-)
MAAAESRIVFHRIEDEAFHAASEWAFTFEAEPLTGPGVKGLRPQRIVYLLKAAAVPRARANLARLVQARTGHTFAAPSA